MSHGPRTCGMRDAAPCGMRKVRNPRPISIVPRPEPQSSRLPERLLARLPFHGAKFSGLERFENAECFRDGAAHGARAYEDIFNDSLRIDKEQAALGFAVLDRKSVV